MTSPRETCPSCGFDPVVSIEVMALAGWVDYFRCRSCGAAWSVPKGHDAPVHVVAKPWSLKMSHAANGPRDQKRRA
jgi:uncharacterized Zn finger protein